MSMENERDAALDRLEDEIETGRVDEIGDFLLEHIAQWGTAHFDAQALAERVMYRREHG